MAYKRFDQELHNKFDKSGRQVVKEFLSKQGIKAEDNEDKYGVDLVLYKNGEKQGYAEVEVRPAWKGAKFPYEDLNIPYRKKKLFSNDLKTVFFSINNEMTHLFWCDAETVLNAKVAVISNKYVKNEKFYKVQLEDLKDRFLCLVEEYDLKMVM